MVKENLQEVEARIMAACLRAGRKREDVTLIAVSKTKPVSMIEEAIEAGLIEFGENKPQELRDKQLVLTQPLHWHMIGSLQSNKVKYVVGKTELIHSVDSYALAEAIEKEAAKKNVCCRILIEVNIAGETTKHGVAPSDTEELIRKISKFPHICICGLMTVAPYTEFSEENRQFFRNLHELYIDIKSKNIDNVTMCELSMGMTGDYEVAIEEGATLVRIGTGLFGQRDYNKGDNIT